MERVNAGEHPDGRLARLEQAGVIRRSASADPQVALARTAPPKVKASVLDALVEERRERR